MVNVVLHWNTCEPVSFKLCMMLDMTALYSLIPSRMALMFAGFRVTEKLVLTCAVILSDSCMGNSGPVDRLAGQALCFLLKSNHFLNPTKPQLQGKVNADLGR